MLVGLKNSFFCNPEKFKKGDFVYVCCYLDISRYYYQPREVENGYGVVVDASYNESYPEYLLESTLIGVYINGNISWYSPREIYKVNSRNASPSS